MKKVKALNQIELLISKYDIPDGHFPMDDYLKQHFTKQEWDLICFFTKNEAEFDDQMIKADEKGENFNLVPVPQVLTDDDFLAVYNKLITRKSKLFSSHLNEINKNKPKPINNIPFEPLEGDTPF